MTRDSDLMSGLGKVLKVISFLVVQLTVHLPFDLCFSPYRAPFETLCYAEVFPEHNHPSLALNRKYLTNYARKCGR